MVPSFLLLFFFGSCKKRKTRKKTTTYSQIVCSFLPSSDVCIKCKFKIVEKSFKPLNETAIDLPGSNRQPITCTEGREINMTRNKFIFSEVCKKKKESWRHKLAFKEVYWKKYFSNFIKFNHYLCYHTTKACRASLFPPSKSSPMFDMTTEF